MIEKLKPFYNNVLSPVAAALEKINVHPNVVTIAGVAVSIAAGYLAATGKWSLAALVVSIGACLDGLDGVLARRTDRKTSFGAVLDSTCDRVTEMAWFFGLIVYYLKHPVWGHIGIYLSYAALCGSILVSYIRARAEGETLWCSAGILQRPERIIILIACFFLGPKAMIIGMALLTLFASITVVQRLVIVFSKDKKKGDWD
jgi:CDP-diacylglycerol---glycerol-3-phosphate 3-phosphatidyltransferase